MPEFNNQTDFDNYIRDTIGLSDAGGALSVTTEIERDAIKEVFGSTYFKNELRTSGAGGEVHWDNVTNTPVLTVIVDQCLFVNPNGANPSDFHTLGQALGNQSNTFITIAAAAAIAESGHTVVVQGGNYTGNVVVNQGQQVSFVFEKNAEMIGNLTYPSPAQYNSCVIMSDGTGKITGDITIHNTTQDFTISGFREINGRFLATGGTLLQGLRIQNCERILNTSFASVGRGLRNIPLITFTNLIGSTQSLQGDIVNCRFEGVRFSGDSNTGFRFLGKFYNCHFEFTGGGFGSFGQVTGSYFFQDCTFKTDQNFLFNLHNFAPGGNNIQIINCGFVTAAAVFNGTHVLLSTLVHKGCYGSVPMLSGATGITEITDGSYWQNAAITL